jgi:hypothetical protein
MTAALLLSAVWLATQRGVIATQPHAPQAFIAVIFLTLDGLLVIGPLWLAALGYGWPLRRWAFNATPYAIVAQAGAGMGVMLIAAWCLACWSLRPGHGLILAGVGWALAALQLTLYLRRSGSKVALNITLPWTLALAAMPAGLLLVAASCPPGTLWAIEAYGYDVMSYHLQLPREWLAAGRMTGLEHNVYSFLPGLIECGYAWLGAWRGSVIEAVYLCQMAHASFAVYGATAAGCLVARVTTAKAGAAAAAILLAAPWSVVTGGMAYNDMAMVAFAAAALLVTCDAASERWPGAAAIGVMLGAAILAKPTAGLLVAVPVGVLMLTRWNHVLPWRPPPTWSRGAGVVAIAAAVALLSISPWLVRNAVQTGNPLFPFACGALGYGHWDAELAGRWDRAHGLSLDAHVTARLAAVGGQWLFNTGYGGVGGAGQTREATAVAVFDAGGGFPLLWLTAAFGLVVSLQQRQTRGLALAMTAMLAMQIAAWAGLTHLQSRFLLPTLLPGVVLAGMGLGRLDAMLTNRMWWLSPSIIVFVALTLTASSLNEFYAQARHLPDGSFAPWDIVDSLDRGIAHHPIDNLPAYPPTHTLMVADAGGLLYIRSPITYATAFDASPLRPVLDAADENSVAQRLAARGVTHVWVGWSELARLHATYGHDPLVTEDALRQLTQRERWHTVENFGHATFYQLP